MTLSKRDSRKLKVFIDYDGPVVAPIKKDQEIAKLKVYKDQELLNETIIFASQDLKKVNFIKSIFNSINYAVSYIISFVFLEYIEYCYFLNVLTSYIKLYSSDRRNRRHANF